MLLKFVSRLPDCVFSSSRRKLYSTLSLWTHASEPKLSQLRRFSALSIHTKKFSLSAATNSRILEVSQRSKLKRNRYSTMASTGDKTICKVGIVQMTSTPDKEATFSQAKDLVKKATEEGAKIVFLPECCDYVGDNRQFTMAAAESIDGDLIQRYKDLAAHLGVWLSLGGLHIKSDVESDHRISNTHVMLNDQGQIVGKYSKTHLFNLDIPGKIRLQETDFTRPGMDIGPPVLTPAGKVGLAICYDMRFPELSLGLTQQGAEILTYPSAFTIPTGKAHWEVLQRARAIENQCYVISAAQVGQHHAKRASYGHAMVVDPWGVVLADLGEEVGVEVVDIDLGILQTKRTEMPVQNHRRYDLYGPTLIRSRPAIDKRGDYQFGQVTVPSSCVFYSTPLVFAFVNKKPVLPGLVSPVRPAARYDDLTPAEVADLSLTVQTVSKVIEKHYGCTSRTIGLQDGPEAGQSIWHVHYHILPRKGGDFKRNDDIYEELETHDKNVDPSQWRTVEDMTEEAARLRTLFP